jgi:hypothetical protein
VFFISGHVDGSPAIELNAICLWNADPAFCHAFVHDHGRESGDV